MHAPDCLLSQLPLLTEAERTQLLRAWNATDVPLPAEIGGVHALLAAQAARTPQALAVVTREARMTYSELNARANQLAHHLRTLGVARDVPVGLCLERAPDYWWVCWASSKPAAPMSPSTDEYPPNASLSCWTISRHPCS